MQFSTQRASIRPLSPNDFQEILKMYHEPDTNKFIPPLRNKTDDFYVQFLEGKVETNENDLGFWAVRHLTTNELIGTVNLNRFKDTDMVHIGAHLSRKFWNKGYSSELLPALINYGFSTRSYEFIHGILSPDHIVSKKLLRKLGFEFYKEMKVEDQIIHIYRTEKNKI